MSNFHLAQCNVARLVAPIDSPPIADFVAALEPINALAEQSPGFMWRLQTDDGNATAIHVFDDEMIIVNMSVWESIDALADFVYKSAHREFMRRRREWFEKPVEAYLALWWIPAGTVPELPDMVRRIERVRADGPTPEAFTFRSPFPAPDAGDGETIANDDWFCPA